MTSSSNRKRVLLAAKLVILTLVCWGIIRSIHTAREELRTESFDWGAIRWSWLAVAAIAYGLSMLPCAWFWRRLLLGMDQQVGWYETFRAYTIGHLGKYVPGKVMVIVLRSGLIRSQSVDKVIAAITVFIETLTMMATGAFWAAISLAVWSRDWRLHILAFGLMCATVFVTIPPVLKPLIRKMKSSEPKAKVDSIVSNIGWRMFASGWIAGIATWACITFSLWATLRGLPGVELQNSLSLFAQLLSSVSLAVVAGFLSLLPGGVGVREWVLDQTLVPLVGQAPSLIAAILLRLIGLLTELLLSLILFVIPPRGSAMNDERSVK